MRNSVPAALKKSLAKQHLCYVLLTCNKPSSDGKMHVEMNYEGDLALASFLVHGAQNVLDKEMDEKFGCVPEYVEDEPLPQIRRIK